MMYFDANGDGSINVGDNIDNEHLVLIVDECDTNDNGSVTTCEIEQCLMRIENEWRAEYCPEAEMLHCEPVYTDCECSGEWDCEDVMNITVEIVAYYDSNGNA